VDARGNGRVERFNPAGEYITQFGSAGSGPGQLSRPITGQMQGIAATNGALWVADMPNNRLERWTHIAPILTSVEPNAGPEAGGTTVTIHGHRSVVSARSSLAKGSRAGSRSSPKPKSPRPRRRGAAPWTWRWSPAKASPR